MKRVTWLLILVLFSCGKQEKYIRMDPQAFSGVTGKSIAMIERIDRPFQVQNFENDALFAQKKSSILVKDRNGRVIRTPVIRQDAGPGATSAQYSGQELSKELRRALMNRFVSEYKLQTHKTGQAIGYKDNYHDGLSKSTPIDFYVDVEADKWRLRWFDFDDSRYYYQYTAMLRIIDGAHGTILGETECDYMPAQNRKPSYDSDIRDFIYTSDDVEFFQRQPFFDDWFAGKGRMLKEHTDKALQSCLDEFEIKVLGKSG